MANLKEEFSSNFIKTEELTKETTYTIEEVEIVEFKEEDGRLKKKVVILFKGRDKKKLVCNATRREALIEMLGEESDDWAGQKIVLYKDKTMFAGKRVDTIGVKAWTPKTPVAASRAPIEQSTDDEDEPDDVNGDPGY